MSEWCNSNMRGLTVGAQTCSSLRCGVACKTEHTRADCMACRALILAMIQRIAGRFPARALSSGALLRAQVHSWDLLDMCLPSMTAFNQRMLVVTILCVSVECEMRIVDASRALEEAPLPKPLSLTQVVECRVLQAMWARA